MAAGTVAKNVRSGHRRSGALFTAAIAAAVVLVSAGVASGQAHLPLTERSGVLPDGQRWQITVPANWNGIVINDLDRIGATSRANALLPQGYAYTGTARHADRDMNWDPRVESNNMVKVLDIFETEFGQPRRAIQFGCSGGGSVALSVAEDHPTRFDGAIPMHASTPIMLANMRLDLTFTLKALLDPADQLPLVPTEGTTAAATQVWVAALTAAQQTAEGRARIALAGVLSQWPAWGSQFNPPSLRPDQQNPAAVQAALVRATVDGLRRALTQRPQWDNPAGFMSWTAGIDYKQFYANADPHHKKIVRDMYALAGLHVVQDIEADLNRINAAPRVAGTEDSIDYWRSRSHTGLIGIPMLHISNIGDAGTPAANMSGYEELVRRVGGGARNLLYRQAFIDAAGHCTFNSAEMMAAVETMVRRIENGKWDNLASPNEMNAVGRTFGLGEPRYIRPGFPAGWTPPKPLNRFFAPDSPGPP
jgi:pimeloyl-ACP methyl ester carboxylesterase